ncbi:hypothetical protein [Tannockella kyphosi]|uniref:hypothetical protein n=1 Tax=Tannockella kyphosi TaxID=2899121 RepID=UPI002011A88B|nr:hypothetical protein [Tannockella kyphosi]
MSEFNQADYINQWSKQNMKSISGRYKKEFVDEFTEACKILGIKPSHVFKQAMTETIEKAKKKSEE